MESNDVYIKGVDKSEYFFQKMAIFDDVFGYLT